MEQRYVIPLYSLCPRLFFFEYFANYIQDKRADVVSKCVSTEPKHGEVWQSISKDPVNAQKSTEQVLKMVADTIN